jgi:hypothetical protein
VNYALLAIAVPLVTAVAVNIWQYRVARRYRQADRRSEAGRVSLEKLQQARRDRRASWEPAFRDADKILKELEDIESEVRAQGPADPNFVSRAGLKRIQWRLENVADRCPEQTQDPLRTVARRVAALSSIIFPSDAEVIDGYTKALASTPPREIPVGIIASQLGARAVEQYRAAVDLHEAIAAAWKAIHTERGGEG